MQFILKARVEYADAFREAFKQMKASFTESQAEGGHVVVFDVDCHQDSIGLLQKLVPIEAYASIGIAGSSPV